jgi:hypothetical protein
MLEARARNQLKNLTDWNELYFRLSTSDLKDRRWHADQFGRQPLSDIKRALKYLDKHDVAKHNVQSVATAKLGTMVAGMMGGKKSKIKPEDFLPFDTKALKRDSGISDESLIVFQRLMKTRKMDGRVIALLADDLKAFSGRNQEQ